MGNSCFLNISLATIRRKYITKILSMKKNLAFTLIILPLVASAYPDEGFNNFWRENIKRNADDLIKIKENYLKKDQEIKELTEKNQILEEKNQILEEKTKKLEESLGNHVANSDSHFTKLDGIVNTMQERIQRMTACITGDLNGFHSTTTMIGGRRIAFSTLKKNWNEAKSSCESNGGQLF